MHVKCGSLKSIPTLVSRHHYQEQQRLRAQTVHWEGTALHLFLTHHHISSRRANYNQKTSLSFRSFQGFSPSWGWTRNGRFDLIQETFHLRLMCIVRIVFLLCCSTIQGTLPKSRHFLFVDDAVSAFLLLLEKGIVGEIYNVGTSCEIPIIQLARELIKGVCSPDARVKEGDTRNIKWK